MRLCETCISMGYVFLCPGECGFCGHAPGDCPDDCDTGCDCGIAICPDCKGFGVIYDSKGAMICLN